MKGDWNLCFDLDDTLIPNSHRYNLPTWRCGEIITKALGEKSPYATEVMQLQFEIDKGMVEEFGFDARRFPLSWVKTYETLCSRAALDPDPGVSRRLRSTAERFKYGPFDPYPGVRDMLRVLLERGFALHLVTAGDERLQRRKIAQSGLEGFFESLHIVPTDKRPALRGIAGSSPARCVMTGDSKRSDIVPAVELGMHAVWKPSNTWNYAHAEVEEGTYHVIKDVTELPDILDRIVGRR